jgi:hypothetical protein
MSLRFEYKYKIHRELLDPIRKEIQPFLSIDPFANSRKEGEYVVRSIYLDTEYFSTYHEKVEGLPYRNKYRIRGYNEGKTESMVFLEIKRKSLNNISKSRILLPFNNLSSLLSGNWNMLNITNLKGNSNQEVRSFLYYFYRYRLQPVILIVYEREPWIGRYDHTLRLTLDKDIRSVLMPKLNDLFLKGDHFLPAMKDYFVLELKFYHTVPAWFKNVITRFNLMRSAVSKYTICIDSHIKDRYRNSGKFVLSKKSLATRLPALMMRSL